MDIDFGTVVLAGTTIAGVVAKWQTTNIIKEGQEALREIQEAQDAITEALADGKLTPEEVERIGKELADALRETSDVLDKATKLFPGRAGKKLAEIRAKIPIVTA